MSKRPGNSSQLNNQSAMSIKTNQNLDRLNKLSERLTNIHVYQTKNFLHKNNKNRLTSKKINSQNTKK